MPNIAQGKSNVVASLLGWIGRLWKRPGCWGKGLVAFIIMLFLSCPVTLCNLTSGGRLTPSPTPVTDRSSLIPLGATTLAPTRQAATRLATTVAPTQRLVIQPSSTPVITRAGATATWPAAPASIMYVSADGEGVYVRSEPTREATVRVYVDGTEMKALGKKDDWCWVTAPDGLVGFVPAEYLVTARPTPLPTIVSATAAPAPVAPVRAATAAPAPAPRLCSKYCNCPGSIPCGNSCISAGKNCNQPPGSACCK